jgi:SHS2 domain-containing protein
MLSSLRDYRKLSYKNSLVKTAVSAVRLISANSTQACVVDSTVCVTGSTWTMPHRCTFVAALWTNYFVGIKFASCAGRSLPAKLETGMFTILPHTADAGLRVEAADLGTLFAEAGCGLFSLIVSNLDDVEPRTTKEFVIAGEDVEYLLFDWLSELLFIFESERLLFREFDVSVGPHGLQATAAGERVDRVRHQMEHEIKAITYHGLVVERTKQGWAAEVIVDI